MKLLFDFLLLIVFFGSYRLARAHPDASIALVTGWFGTIGADGDQRAELSAVIVATLGAMAVAVIQIAWLLLRRQSVKPTVWISAVIIAVFGGLTLWLQNEWFIKWKPSVLYWIFALILTAGKLLWRRNLIGSLLSTEIELPPAVWDRLLFAWTAFFFALGAANLVVAYSVSTDAWVNFKTFGLMGMILVASIATVAYMARYLKPETDA